MQFHVLGLGPIGSLLAHNLRRAIPRNPEIVLIHRNQEQALAAARRGDSLTVETNGVVTYSKGFRSEVFEGPDLHPPARPKQSGRNTSPTDDHSIQSLFVSAKAQQTLPAIQRLQHRLSPFSTIVLLQNGMGMYEELINHVFPEPGHRPHFIFATNNHGAYMSPDRKRVIHAGLGSIDFGIVPDENGRDFEASASKDSLANLSINDITKPGDPDYERYKYLRSTVAALQLLEDLNVSWQPISHIQLTMRRKVVVNSVINPLTALMRCRNGDILKSPSGAAISARVCQEAANVFAAQMEAENTVSEGEEYPRLPPMLTAKNLEREVARVAELTANNKSSMLNDIEKGRSIELDYINGYIMRLGALFNVPVPTTTTLYHLMKMRSSIPLDQLW
ncbi:hypothetical protein NMY22_g1198 [Coprinellus aureogranulatus]|nr:hypothetical protein NMY22_g1198 [Coprinellus aureogranulatus]